MTSLSALIHPARARWQALDAREKSLARTAAAVLTLAVLWWVAIAPALAVWRQAESRQRSLDTRWQRIQTLAAEAQALRAQPVIQREEALRALEASAKQYLGAGTQVTLAGDRATLALRNVDAGALAQWLPLARVDARAVPVEAKLTRVEAPPRWSGTLVLSLPPQ